MTAKLLQARGLVKTHFTEGLPRAAILPPPETFPAPAYYVITDINKEYDKDVMVKLKAIENAIKVRVLY